MFQWTLFATKSQKKKKHYPVDECEWNMSVLMLQLIVKFAYDLAIYRSHFSMIYVCRHKINIIHRIGTKNEHRFQNQKNNNRLKRLLLFPFVEWRRQKKKWIDRRLLFARSLARSFFFELWACIRFMIHSFAFFC